MFDGSSEPVVSIGPDLPMQHADHNPTSRDIASSVRGNALSAAIAAALMIVFGFYYLGKPTGAGLFSLSALAFYYTLRIGGIAMAAIAVGSLAGFRPVLLVDAVVSIAIGVLFVLTGVGMLVGGGGAFQTILSVVFGGMFISAGVRNWRDYFLLPAVRDRPLAGIDTSSSRDSSHGDAATRAAPPVSSLGSQLRERMASPADSRPPLPPAPASATSVTSDHAPPPNDKNIPAADEQTPTGESCEQETGPSPDGFLASFADKEPPPKT